MKMIKAPSVKDKLNLFVQLADEDGNELLSFEEIQYLAKISISNNFLFQSKKDQNFV